MLQDPLPEIPQRRVVGDPLPQVKVEFRPFSVNALHLKTAVHQLQQLERNIHSETGPFDMAVPALLDPPVRLIQLGQILFFDADSRVLDFKMQNLIIDFAAPADPEPHMSLRRVLNRVRQNIGQHLADAHIVTVIPRRQCPVHIDLKNQILRFCPR